jgi:hypothetical protein
MVLTVVTVMFYGGVAVIWAAAVSDWFVTLLATVGCFLIHLAVTAYRAIT